MTYDPPPKSACDFDEYRTPLDEFGQHEVILHTWSYRGRVVRFSIVQQYREAMDAAWEHVYRADVKYGEVHDHTYRRSDGSNRYRTLEIVPDKGWETVDRWYGELAVEVFTQANERLRRWAG